MTLPIGLAVYLLYYYVLFFMAITQTSALSTETFYRISNEIDHAHSAVFPSEIFLEIHNPKPPSTHWYAITIETYNRYSGRAKLLNVGPSIAEQSPLVFSWTPPFSAGFSIIVHELPLEPNESDITVPFPIKHVTVKNKLNLPGPWGLSVDRMRMLPPCQNVQRMDVYSVWDGAWIGPVMHSPTDRLRNNWFFLPSEEMDCKIETFTEYELKLLQEEKRIYILGNSRERGIFLSLVDLLLDGEEKRDLQSSVVGQCWGRAVVSKHNMNVMYQDWRSDHFDTRSTEPTVVCHNEKVAREGGPLFFESALMVWEEIFRGDKSTLPHVILMSTGNDISGFKSDNYDINKFVKSLPRDWDGTLFLTDGAFSATLAGRGDATEYEVYRSKLKELTFRITDDKRVRWIDGMGFSKDNIMYGEFGPDRTTISQHFHRNCNEIYEDVTGELKSMAICSNVTENIAQLLIGHAVGPKSALMAIQDQDLSHPKFYSPEVVTCHSCPETLLPFHITPYPDMKCNKGPLQPRSIDEISGHLQTCPVRCMDLEVQQQLGDPPNEILERSCPYRFFPRGFQVGSDALRSRGYIEKSLGFSGHTILVFNFVILTVLVGYQYRAKIKGYMFKVLDPDRSNI